MNTDQIIAQVGQRGLQAPWSTLGFSIYLAGEEQFARAQLGLYPNDPERCRLAATVLGLVDTIHTMQQGGADETAADPTNPAGGEGPAPGGSGSPALGVTEHDADVRPMRRAA